MDGREAHVAEPVHADPANLGQPAGIARRTLLAVGLVERALETGRAGLFRDGFHHETGTGCVFAGGSFSSQA